MREVELLSVQLHFLPISNANRICRGSAKFRLICRDLARTIQISYEFVVQHIPWFEDDNETRAELKVYQSSLDDVVTSQSNPLEFRSQAAHSPKLAEIAAICLSIPVNSVAAKRSFSIYADSSTQCFANRGLRKFQCGAER